MLRVGVVVGLVCVAAGFAGCGSEFTGGEASSGAGGTDAATGGTAGRGGSGGGAGKSGAGGSSDGGEDASTGGAGGGAGVGGGSGAGGGSGSGGGSGAVGTGGNAGAGGVSGTAGCSANGRGPSPVEVVTPSGRFCVDATEVTNTQYLAFLATNPATTGQPAQCAWNADFKPSAGWPTPLDRGNHPVAFVDWCDARAFCNWAGKRLCGKIGGGPNGFTEHADPSKSQWFAACSANGARIYPYGPTYDANKCNGADYPTPGVLSVVATGCEGGFAGLRDLSGNVWEWEDSCSGNTGINDTCHARGGYYESTPEPLRCDYDQRFYRNAASVTDGYLGFRCCSP